MDQSIALYLMRHAHAVPGEQDPGRPLSERGRRQVTDMARFFAARPGMDVERVWHSPLVRARETADLFCDRLGISATRRMMDGLRPDDDVEGIARRLSGFDHSLLVVGHQPHLSMLAAELVTRDRNSRLLDFKKGAILCLERDAAGPGTICWRIRWFLTPGVVAKKAES